MTTASVLSLGHLHPIEVKPFPKGVRKVTASLERVRYSISRSIELDDFLGSQGLTAYLYPSTDGPLPGYGKDQFGLVVAGKFIRIFPVHYKFILGGRDAVILPTGPVFTGLDAYPRTSQRIGA